MRALPSMPPPGAKGTMSVMGRVGQACAAASPLHAIAAANARDSNFICLERALPLGILVQYQRPHIEGFVSAAPGAQRESGEHGHTIRGLSLFLVFATS